jgi:NAD-dependent deacetylase
MDQAIAIAEQADIFVVIGTSLVVYPAAGLVNYTAPFIPKFVVDKKIPDMRPMRQLTTIEAPATTGINQLKEALLKLV